MAKTEIAMARLPLCKITLQFKNYENKYLGPDLYNQVEPFNHGVTYKIEPT